MAEQEADLAFVVGGYNSSNTMHLVEILEHSFPTYHVRDASEFKSENEIHHFDQWKKEVLITNQWLPESRPLKVAITSGASCPDVLVDEVMLQILSYFDDTKEVDEVIEPFAVSSEQDAFLSFRTK